MLIEKKKVLEAFQAYVKGYDVTDPRVKLKIEHTYRVASLCERIAESLDYSMEDKQLAWLIGMLHDIGRFEQLKNFGTFNDAKSINHASYGTDLLFEKGEIRRFIEEDKFDTLIYTAILNHNIYILPSDLDKRTMEFCNLLRDADKIDIIKINADLPIETIYDFTEEQMKQSFITEEVLEAYYKRQAIHHKLKKSAIDYLIGHVSLVFELVFPISKKIVAERGYLDKILQMDSKNEIAIGQLAILRTDMREYLQ